jgi:hypothetical protein
MKGPWSGKWALVLGLLLAVGNAPAAVLQVPAQYPTIQAAIDAAAPEGGDEIIVSAGTYEEQLVINHDVTITGAGTGLTTLLAPAFMPHVAHTLQYNAVIHAESLLGAVVLRDFTIDGAGRGRPGTRFTGIMYERCGGVTERVDIVNFFEMALVNVNSGIGFYAYSEPSDGLQLRVQDMAITTFQKAGFTCFGHGCELDLRNIVADPTGFHDLPVQNGFELLNDTFGSITNCIARSCWHDGSLFPNATSCGFVFYYAREWTVLDSLADRNQTGFYCLATNMTMTGADVIGYPDQLAVNYGIVTTGVSPTMTGGVRLGLPRTLEETKPLPAREFGTYATLDRCSLQGDSVPGSLGLVALSGLGENDLEVNNSGITGWDLGIVTYETNGWVTGKVRTCRIQDNMGLGILVQTLRPFDARGNFWGDPTGPYHPSSNPDGLGEEISNNVLFDPWLRGNVVCAPVPQYIALADGDNGDYSRELVVRYLGGDSEPVYGFSAEVTWNQDKLSASQADFSRPDEGVFQSAVLFQVMPIADGFRIEAALGGDQVGIHSGEMFKIRFHLIGEPDYVEVPINLEVRHLRDNQNQEIAGSLADDGLVIGDLEPPQFTTLKLTNTSLPHTDDFVKNGDLVRIQVTAQEDDPHFGLTNLVGDFLSLLGGPGYLRLPDSYQDSTATWLETPVSSFPTDGPILYTVRATDPAGNTATADSTVIADNTAPRSVGGLVAITGHNRVDLQWEDPGDLDDNLREVVIRSSRTNLYPLYDAPEPAYPATPAEGQEVFTGLGSTAAAVFPDDGTQRDIVSFQAFAVDQVGLVSPTTGSSRARVTNYFLADVTAGIAQGYDQVTDIYDVTRLGDTFDLDGSEPGFDPECDVGPTDDGTSSGLPLPDGNIDLDDLMVFADRFGVNVPPPAGLVMSELPAVTELAWTRQAPDLWTLQLTAPGPQLKALHLHGSLPANLTLEVEAGELLRQQPAPYFFHAGPSELDVHVALLGPGAGFQSTGELLRVTTSRPLNRLAVELEARSVSNTHLVTSLTEEVAPAPLPRVFALHGNYPNPFNPATTIAFDLPSSQPVNLVIYSLNGHLVKRLVNGRLPAGRHEVIWRGLDDRKRTVAAGTYLYRLEAGSWSDTGKLNLVK